MRTEILKHVDNAVGRRAKLHLGQVAGGQVQIPHSLGFALVGPGEVRFVTHLVRIDSGFDLLQRSFHDPNLNAVLGAIHYREHLGFAGVQAGALDAVLGLHLVHGVGFVVHHLGGLQLLDVAVGRAHGGGALDDVLLLLNGVEFDHHIALLDGPSVVRQVDNAQARHLGSREDGRMGALDGAAGAHTDDEIRASDARHGDLDLGGPGVAIGGVQAAATHSQPDDPGDDFHPGRVGAPQALLRSEIFRCHNVCSTGNAAPGYMGRWSAITSPFFTPERMAAVVKFSRPSSTGLRIQPSGPCRKTIGLPFS